MSINKADFVNNGVNFDLLCSKCHEVIKNERDFSALEKFACDGVVSLMPQYCEKHKYKGMNGSQRRKEMVKNGIREMLKKEIMNRNILGVEITKPTQKLTLMRGVSGCGKSTKAKEIALETYGIIHSTDDVIKNTTNYNDFYNKINETNNFFELSKMHHTNFLNAMDSIKRGINNTIIDNTNIKASDCKIYVEGALKLGLNENNINIIEIGDGNVSIDVLAKRNTHNVPIGKTQKMINSYNGIGKLTVTKILESKIKHNTRVLYSAVILMDESRKKLLKLISRKIPTNFKIFAHHMTISFGKPLEDRGIIGDNVTLTATDIGISDMAMAVKVEGYPSNNDIPHITIAVNVAEGGKPYDSNKIVNWTPLEYPINLSGIVKEIMSK